MLPYNPNLKQNARKLRTNMTNTEQILWSQLRRKQILDVQFYRQKPIGNYIVDFYAPKVKLVVEVDGSQHLETRHLEYDTKRDLYLKNVGLQVLRFNNLQVIQEIDVVVETIAEWIRKFI
jgi:very-short-patch-repair endonuclease